MRQELPPLLESTGLQLGEALKTFIENEAPRNVSAHQAYAYYYSDELKNLVAQRDAEVIERHAYAFEGS